MQAEERVALASMKLQGISLRAIGSAFGRSPGTLGREVSRNSCGGANISRVAQASCQVRVARTRSPSKLDPDVPLWPFVSHMLGWLWSPQPIAQTLRIMVMISVLLGNQVSS